MQPAHPGDAPPAATPIDTGPADLIRLLWRGKWAILMGALLGIGAAAFFMSLSPPQYVASAIIMPSDDSGRGGAGGKGRGLAAVASIAGVSLGQDGNPYFVAMRQLIKTPRVYAEVDAHHHVLPEFFYKRWDAQRRTWLPPTGFVAGVSGSLKRAFGVPVSVVPGTSDLAELLDDKLAVSEIERTGIYTVTLKWKDPAFARSFVTWVITTADDVIRRDARQRLVAQIENLDRRLATVQIAEHRAALSDLLAAQERQLMVIVPDQPFSVQILQPAIVPERPDSPKVGLTLLLGAVAGAIFAALAWVLIRAMRAA